MGATGWTYWIPYQSDLDKALRELKEQVFARGEYNKPFTAEDYLEILGEKADPRLARALPSRASLTPPQTIGELLRQCAESGTGSILDIERVAAEPQFGAIAPLPNETLRNLFGTEKPTQEMVAQWAGRIPTIEEPRLYRREQGIYVITYQGGEPNQVYIEGCSGD
ncbi:MAG TPA: hypothetical protein VFA07_11220 [Chthonomonadaceae bacterium]|nr:hypothetical protein [Chthonomonadaceae bacterium]